MLVAENAERTVESLRSAYREVKTQRVNEHAEAVCRMAADLASHRS